MVYLGVNIDHIATVRNARGGISPEPITAAAVAELGGADRITVHLREDRRHITDRDLRLLKEITKLPINLEMACNKEITEIACLVGPDMCTLVPERREELTTEGGLDVVGNFEKIKKTVHILKSGGIKVSLFIDPDGDQIDAAVNTGVSHIELHTGSYAEAKGAQAKKELDSLYSAAEIAQNSGLIVNAGHGLDYQNVIPVAQIKGIHELNIGHSIISRALFVGLERAVREMKALINPSGI